VQIGHAGQENGVALVAGLRRGAGFDGGDAASVERDPDIALPALGQQRLFRKDRRHVHLQICMPGDETTCVAFQYVYT
jgi:hypothetical protein